MIPIRILRSNKASLLCFANYNKDVIFKFEKKRTIPFHNQHNLTFSRLIHQGSIAEDLRNDRSYLGSKNMSHQDHLEKWIAQLSGDIHQKNRIYKNDFLKVLGKVAEHNFSSKRQGLLLINCCGYLLPDETPSSRLLLLDQVWNILKPHTEFTVEHYNDLLKVYAMNNHTVNVSSFINQMAPVKPNELTYKFILNAVCEAGDLNQAIEVLSNLKAIKIALTESMFNSFIVGHGKERQIDKIQEVLLMMDDFKVTKTIDTYTAIIRAYSYCGRPDLMSEVYKAAVKQGETFTEQHVMDVVKTLAANKQYSHVPMALLYLPYETLSNPSISPYMQSVCTQLVHQNHPMVALDVYKCLPIPSFGPKDDRALHGRSLIRDCVKASIPVNVIIVIAQDLLKSGRNKLGLQSACEAALQIGKVPLALDLYTEMYQKNLPLRPHYFWPILIETAKNSGEKGIMSILSMMLDLNVVPDYETILNYILPYVSFSSPQNLMKKFTECGLSVSNMLTPMMVILLSSGQSRAASELCELFEGHLDGDKLMKPLVQGYISNGDAESTVYILKVMTEKNKKGQRDWIGRFLSELFVKMRTESNKIKSVISEIERVKLKIAPGVAESCLIQLEAMKANYKVKDELMSAIKSLIDSNIVDELEISTAHAHPREMDETSLRAHLVELEAKGMNTRGVLRRLLQLYCRKGNVNAAKEILEKCEQEGVNLSSGMKASIFDLHVKSGNLESAELALSDLLKTSPNFVLDEFKIIDYATLMVYRGKMDQTYDFINGMSKGRRIKGGKSMEGNCWRLLDVIAANGASNQADDMFNLLQQLGYCQPSNVILGPLIRVHLKSNNLAEAVTRHSQIAKKYRKTPLKHELICKLLSNLKEQNEEDSFSYTGSKSDGTSAALIHTVLNVNLSIHGRGDAQISLIAALADVGCKSPLRKMFLDPNVKIHHDALMKICKKFALEKKIDALELLAVCSRDVRNIDSQEIYEATLNVHQLNDDCQSALSLWYRMQEADITPSRKFIEQLASMLKLNKKNLPSDLVAYFNKNARINVINKQ